jgi:hypothetical protein
MMTEYLVRLRNDHSDEANVSGVSYPRHADGFFYVPGSVAQQLLGHGFYRPDAGEHPEVGSVSLEEAIDMVFALELGPVRAALIATLSAHGAL